MPSDRPTVSWRRSAATVIAIAWSADRWRTVLAFVLLGSRAIVQTLFAYWLKLLLDGIADRDPTTLVLAAAGVIGSVAGTAALAHAGGRVLTTLSGELRYGLNLRLLRVAAGVPNLDLHETPEHLTQLEAVRREQYQLYAVVPRLVELLALAVRLLAMGLLLAAVHPALLLLPLFGIPAVLVSPWTGGLFREGQERAAEPARRAEHLLELTATAGAAKEIRLFRLAGVLLARFAAEQRTVRRIHHRLQLRAAVIGIGCRAAFLVGYVGAVVLVVVLAASGRASVGDAVLTAVLAGQVLGLVTGAAEALQLTFQSLVAAGRLVYLADLEKGAGGGGTGEAPDRLERGIRLERVSYTYPGADRPVLREVDLTLPAGATVAIVGDNGAGKSTVVKLLAGLYRPTGGRILLDDTDLAGIDPVAFRRRTSACFQDHARFEFPVRDAVGLGDLDALADPEIGEPAIARALDRAGAAGVVAGLPAGLDTQLGPSWPGGVDLSGGQWQKLALARAMMRPQPLLLLLDEPAAALDAAAEHELFLRWALAARLAAETNGGITVLVSHRFSTVRMTDLVVVCDQGRVTEVGTHAELISRGGHYAEMYDLQARSYR
ncbi:ABC transporter ATP-binding protein [Microlunatus speluncae]|uniref:ABC transporter ATP-binding protein n=1 Tax=Microlunatus speluncae TaxID=2594267 RepID=UPI001266232C|nr:ABC transporter ATP-binding protein [Microlunatus speluncae]